MNGVSPRPVCQSRCCNPNASPSRTPVSASSIHSSRLRTDPRHSSRVGVPARARLADPLDLRRRQRSAAATTGDAAAPGSPPAGGPCAGRCVPAAACTGPARCVIRCRSRPDVHAVEHVVVVAGDHRRQPHRDRRLRKPRRPTLDRDDLGLVPGAQPGQEAPNSSNVTASQRQSNASQVLPPQRQRPRVGLHGVRRRLLGAQILQVLLGRLRPPGDPCPAPSTCGSPVRQSQPLRPIGAGLHSYGCHAPQRRNHR